MPTCCSNSSAAVTSTTARSSPPTGHSPNGARFFQTPPASSPWSIAWYTTPRSSPSRANPIASRRPANDPSSAHAIAALAAAFAAPAHAGIGPQITNFTLSNGLEVIVIPDHRAPVVTHMVWYKVGSADETPGKSGLAHFLEHLK